ncbi:hypothetical protein, partial [Rhizobium metallidurans]|uniref:hypothetical protein n=1 Tax=Rhizobium metallidurans TaxID=1265931 RepID=UPI001AEDE3E1
QSASQPIQRNPERKSPSPAAPPPSFREAAYKAPNPNKSTDLFQKIAVSDKKLFLNANFQTRLLDAAKAPLKRTLSASTNGDIGLQRRETRPLALTFSQSSGLKGIVNVVTGPLKAR